MRYGSVCSGIEAASVAWHPLGWDAAFYSEIEPFPCRLLQHYYPSTPNYGDLTRYCEWPDESIDLLVGGTPCQSFSVAGLRQGLADPRGNLALVYLGLLDRYRPRWMVWENVPGVLSSSGGRDFGAFLGGLGQLGYGWAYRVLDAQYLGVAQRRRRVFVVGYLGDWRRAAAVLVEPQSLSGDSPPRRTTGERAAACLGVSAASSSSPNVGNGQGNVVGTLSARTKGGGGLGTDMDLSGGLVGTLNARGPYSLGIPEVDGNQIVPIHCAEVAPTLDAHYGDKMGMENQHIDGGGGLFVPVANTLHAADGHHMVRRDGDNPVAHALRADGFDASEDGTGRETPIVPTLTSNGDNHSGFKDERGLVPLLSIDLQQVTSKANRTQPSSESPPLTTHGSPVAFQSHGVRRLTPRECERLQGFPDDYTLIPGAKDGPRYKVLGNSMAVPVVRWIGERIATVDAL